MRAFPFQADPMKKIVFALAASLTVLTASAQVGKAASEATDSAKHKIDQKRADSTRSLPHGEEIS